MNKYSYLFQAGAVGVGVGSPMPPHRFYPHTATGNPGLELPGLERQLKQTAFKRLILMMA